MNTATWIPKGYVEGTHPRVTSELADMLARDGAQTGALSVALRVQEGKHDEALAFLRERPERRGHLLQPRLFTAELTRDEIDEVIANESVFAWVGRPYRFTGAKLTDAAASAAVKLSVARGKEADVKAAVQAIGGRVLGSGATEVLALMSAGDLAELLRIPGIDGADVSAA